MNWINRLRRGFLVAICLVATSFAAHAVDVGKWRRHVVALPNATYAGNPFELAVNATFTHTSSGTTLTLPGYYAGSDTWKVGFMPTLTGNWNWITSSADPELNGKTGSLNCVPSGLPGLLVADPDNPRKWKFQDGDYVVPMAFRLEFFSEPGTISAFTTAADFLADGVKGHMYETRLVEEYGRFGGRTDFIFEGDWRDHRFDLVNWDRMEQRMEVLAARGIGGHIMFYSDDLGTPDWNGQSATEALVIRYVVARLAGYPVVLFNTGIDVQEYRSASDITWMGTRIRELDPYGHPVSSRTTSPPILMASRTFDSHAFPNEARVDAMIANFQSTSRPVSCDDAWGENRSSHPGKDHRPADIRRAFWKGLIAGGVGGLVRGGDELSGSYNGFFSIPLVEQELESEQWLSLINPFIANRLGSTFGVMTPAASLAGGNRVYALADPARTKILYLALGSSDRYEPGGGSLTLRLGGLSESFAATWFDTRSGVETSAGSFAGGQDHTVAPPSGDDWVLLLSRSTDTSAPSVPSGVTASATGSDTVQISWSPSSDGQSGVSNYRVYRDGVHIAEPQAAAYTDTGLQPGTSYAYEISAVNGAGIESSRSAAVSATTNSVGSPPPAPSGIQVD